MPLLNQVDRMIDADALRKRSAVWVELANVLGLGWSGTFETSGPVQVDISVEEVLADLGHGRE